MAFLGKSLSIIPEAQKVPGNMREKQGSTLGDLSVLLALVAEMFAKVK